MNSQKDTSFITLLSSEHGRLRREQRDIDKRDLQKALKYGTRTPAWGHRWLVEYDGITFITDSTMKREVTAYPSALPEMKIDWELRGQHEKAKRLLHEKTELATSHTVIVIDNSGSMLSKKNDVHLYRDSQNAAFSLTALQFVAEQLFNETAVNSDLISLVKFSKTAKVEISREPIGWPVYNKLLSHRNTVKYMDRKLSPILDTMNAGSNFLPALDQAEILLRATHHDRCALSLFFFSDGLSTDHDNLNVSAFEAKKLICNKIESLTKQFDDTFTVTIVGLGNPNDAFETLNAMSTAASNAGAKAKFEFCNKTANSITSAISSTVSSTSESRLSLMKGRRNRFTQREDLTSEKDAVVKFDWQYFWIQEHFVYNPLIKDVVPMSDLPLAAAQSNPIEAIKRQKDPPRYLAVNRNYAGKGAERVAFRSRLSDAEGVQGFVFETMVAKETKDVELIDKKIEFHKGFMETQDLANYLAKEFNKRLRGIPGFDPLSTPKIEFLDCSVLLLHDPNWPTGRRGVLVEKMLDTERFQWTKWNDNNGMVDGKRQHMHLDVDFELKQLEKEKGSAGLVAITEEEEYSDDEDSVSDDECEIKSTSHNHSEEGHGEHVKASDYLQAFTHFTYRYTSRKVMVCDLQGIYNTERTPPTLELTDPAIHYSSKNGRRMVFGRTDKGRSGMNNFFRTHKCTKICKFLELSAKNKKWKRDWHHDRNQRRESNGRKTAPMPS